ncbi:MAG: hypothetical protein IH604_21610 [Burkholderiales bacterium]|nr:hypothetical protein [Burkholderiales bacterium]
MSNTTLRRYLNLCCLIVLLAGLGSATLIYLTAEEVPDDSLGYVVVDGVLYPLSTSDSKTYRREVQRFGGKAALLFDDFGRWFAERWRGKTLGKTIAWLSALVSLGTYLFGRLLGPDAKPTNPDLPKSDRPG